MRLGQRSKMMLNLRCIAALEGECDAVECDAHCVFSATAMPARSLATIAGKF